MRIAPASLPEPYRRWLLASSPEVKFFAREPQRWLSALVVAVVAIAPAVFLIDRSLRLLRGAPLDGGDVAAGLVALAFFVAALRWVLRERRRARALADGSLRLGLFLGGDALLWYEAERVAWHFPRAQVASVELTATSAGKGGPIAHELCIHSSQGTVRVPAGDYPARAFLDALALAWPEVRIVVAPALVPPADPEPGGADESDRQY